MRDLMTSAVLRSIAATMWLCVATAVAAGESVAVRWTPPAISSDQYESSPTFTPDGREIYFMRADKTFQNYRILWSRCDSESGAWTTPVAPSFAAAAPVLEADPFIAADGKRLYYVSSRQAKVADDLDIWYVDRKPDGAWGQPQRLPEPVNSPGSELLPRVDAQGRLYFGSSREGGFGQSDIYVATQGKEGNWRVDNAGAPISTSANEYEAEVSRDGRTMIVVADRGDRSHLYRYRLQDGKWVEQGRVPAFTNVFQVGPLLSPKGDRLLFSQADGERSGEMFLIDLVPNPDKSWPPTCGAGATAK
jgi:Tol biopolymer transport system component